jgi:2-enoate reductase
MKLFEPGKIGTLFIKNRIVMAPMGTTGLVEGDGRLSQRGIDYYTARAKGGTGLIMTGLTRVSRKEEEELGIPFLPRLMADSNIYVARLNELADAMHDYGAKVAVQLTAGLGRVAVPRALKKSKPRAPTAMPCLWDPSILTHELTVAEIEELVQAFELSAEVVRTAGIDAVELHGHEGYLLDQFKTSLWNKRTDKYGGSFEGRLRFPLEVIRAIKKGAGEDFPIVYRFALTHYLPGGREVEEGLEIARRLEAAGIDALDVDAGCFETWYWPHPPTYQPPGCMIKMAEMVKKVVRIPVIAVGRLGYPELAESVLQEGKADFIALGRALLADPDWPNKVKEGREEDIRPCLGDHECVGRIVEGKYLSCAVNPMTGMERDFAIEQAERKKTVLVIGGGPSGMEAARNAAIKGHKVTLWEKEKVLGGNLIPASVPYFKQDYKSLIDYLSVQIKKLGITIELGKEATPELILRMKPDAVLIATGGTPIIPDITGVGNEKVITAVDLLLAKKEAGESVAIVGGGLTGCETALYLAQQGKRVTIVEALDGVARDVPAPNRMQLTKLLDEALVKILTETDVLEINDSGITVCGTNGNTSKLAADTVVLAIGLKSSTALLEALEGKLQEVYAIGDCVKPRRVVNAIWEAFRTVRLI